MTNLLETERLVIRSWIPERDTKQAFEIYSDPQVTYFLGTRETSIESQHQKLVKINERYSRLNNGSGFWAVVEKETAIVLGAILLKTLPDNYGSPTQDYEVGWHLRRISWGKGYATEAGRAMLNYGFSIMQLPVIYAVVKPQNHASIRVTQKLDMESVGLTNKYYDTELLLFQKDAPQKIKGATIEY